MRILDIGTSNWKDSSLIELYEASIWFFWESSYILSIFIKTKQTCIYNDVWKKWKLRLPNIAFKRCVFAFPNDAKSTNIPELFAEEWECLLLLEQYHVP